MAKRALIVGIDSYDNVQQLTGCVADALAIRALLARNADAGPNYSCRLLTCGPGNSDEKITRPVLKRACQELFDFTGELLLYFSGHGALTDTGGYLATCDARRDDWGIPMQDIIQLANNSRATDILLMFDCCHAGDVGNAPILNTAKSNNPLAVLRENLTIIAASRNSQSAMESGGHGLFTTAVLDGLDGGAADHFGWVTAASLYSFVERRFGAWAQRPIYKSHVTELTLIRQCAPLIDRLKLYEIVKLFPTEDYKYQLDPEFEPEDEFGNLHEPVNEEKVAIAQLFKAYRDAGLLRASAPNEQFFWAARRSHTVELTLRGREYWRLVTFSRI
jgi:hypothetical protein